MLAFMLFKLLVKGLCKESTTIILTLTDQLLLLKLLNGQTSSVKTAADICSDGFIGLIKQTPGTESLCLYLESMQYYQYYNDRRNTQDADGLNTLLTTSLER
jgi:hypothetical protein